jgi:hypothetical protein
LSFSIWITGYISFVDPVVIRVKITTILLCIWVPTLADCCTPQALYDWRSLHSWVQSHNQQRAPSWSKTCIYVVLSKKSEEGCQPCMYMQDWFFQPTVQYWGIQLELNLHGLVLKLRSVLVDGSSRLLFGVCLGENSLSWVLVEYLSIK